MLGGGLTWFALAFLVFAVFLFSAVRVGRVTGEHVGIMLNKITGKMTVITQSGTRIYNGITNDFYVLDKTLQTLDGTEATQEIVVAGRTVVLRLAGAAGRRGKPSGAIASVNPPAKADSVTHSAARGIGHSEPSSVGSHGKQASDRIAPVPIDAKVS